MTPRGPHFVGQGGLPSESRESGMPDEIKSERNIIHDTLLAILDRGEITEDNVNILAQNMGVVSLQQLLDRAMIEKRLADATANEKHINRYINDVRSRIIQSMIKFGVRYALAYKKTISPDMINGDTREININHSMVETLKRQTNT